MSCSSKFSCIMTMITNFLVYCKCLFFIFIITKLFLIYVKRARSLVVSDLRSETKGSRFESGCQLCAEVNSLQQSPG